MIQFNEWAERDSQIGKWLDMIEEEDVLKEMGYTDKEIYELLVHDFLNDESITHITHSVEFEETKYRLACRKAEEEYDERGCR